MDNNSTAGHVGWVVGAVGLVVGGTSLAMIHVSREVAQMQGQQMEWMRERLTRAEARIELLEAYQYAKGKQDERSSM